MASEVEKEAAARRTRTWTLSAATTLGSSVRAKGILLEMRSRLPGPVKKSLDILGMTLILEMPASADKEFAAISDTVTRALQGIESLPIIPREIEDILAISTSERHRWLKDGRLKSEGTRTVRLAGRARKITFHVFDPRFVEDVLDRDLTTIWREEDAETAAENRRRARWKAAQTRADKKAGKSAPQPDTREAEQEPDSELLAWGDFERDGPLR